jgi:hypothetical protein
MLDCKFMLLVEPVPGISRWAVWIRDPRRSPRGSSSQRGVAILETKEALDGCIL